MCAKIFRFSSTSCSLVLFRVKTILQFAAGVERDAEYRAGKTDGLAHKREYRVVNRVERDKTHHRQHATRCHHTHCGAILHPIFHILCHKKVCV